MEPETDFSLADYLCDLPDPEPEPMTPAERTAAWREEMKRQSRPDTRAVDTAIVEATSFLLSLATGSLITVEAAALVRVATIVLVRDGYSRKLAKAGVIDRLRPRPQHSGMAHMPSRQLHGLDRLIEQPVGGEWEQRDIAYMRRITGQTLPAPPLPPHTA